MGGLQVPGGGPGHIARLGGTLPSVDNCFTLTVSANVVQGVLGAQKTFMCLIFHEVRTSTMADPFDWEGHLAGRTQGLPPSLGSVGIPPEGVRPR